MLIRVTLSRINNQHIFLIFPAFSKLLSSIILKEKLCRKFSFPTIRGGPKPRSFGRRPKLFSLRLRHRPPKLSLETFGLSFYPKSWLLLHINFDLKDNFDLENLFPKSRFLPWTSLGLEYNLRPKVLLKSFGDRSRSRRLKSFGLRPKDRSFGPPLQIL